MARCIGWLRGLAILTLALLTAACMPMEPPRVLGSGPPAMAPSQLRVLSSAPVKGAAVTVALEPLTGAPAEQIYAMEDAMKAIAPSRNLKLVPATDTTAVYRLKGYISAVGDGQSGLMVYVWDVSDAGGNKLHRISGQERAEGNQSDPWAGVSAREISNAARETVDALAAWLRT